jgi:phage tail sheath gpL-like
MKPKIEVTDEMEQRFCDYVNTHEGCTYRAALEAALNPPPEPEIKVTLEMGIAGQVLALEARNKGACGDADLWVLVKDIYRAMRKLEPNQ